MFKHLKQVNGAGHKTNTQHNKYDRCSPFHFIIAKTVRPTPPKKTGHRMFHTLFKHISFW